MKKTGTYLPSLQRLQSSRHPTRPQSGRRMGPIRYPRKHHLARLYRDRYGGSAVREIPTEKDRLAYAEYARTVEQA